jgi:hypothetical protein
MQYEGYVRYADKTIVSLQCFEGRHDECPAEIGAGGSPVLEGYYCECPECPE